MKVAKDFRREARAALRGNWWMAVLVGLVALALGANTIMAANGISNDIDTQSILDNAKAYFPFLLPIVSVMVGGLPVMIFIYNIVALIISGATTLGYVNFNMKLLDGISADFHELFSGFSRFKEGFKMHFFRMLYMLLWNLVVWGVALLVYFLCFPMGRGFAENASDFVVLVGEIFILVKRFNYAMVPYIVYDNPDIGARAALKKSVSLMNGNKWRLFCLMFSFIGWGILTILFTAGIGYLWLRPYQEAAYAAFYREITAERNQSYNLT